MTRNFSFYYKLRVRYSEIDAQKIVFNATESSNSTYRLAVGNPIFLLIFPSLNNKTHKGA